MTTDDLKQLFDAFNRHDIDAVMAFFAADCVFNAVGGVEVFGTRFAGADAIRAAFSGTFAAMPDARWDHHGHFIHGNRAVSEWVFTGTNADGTRIEADGCDVFTLRDGKIVRKQAFRKQRPPLPASAKREG
ncbi:Ketosteroid isomerase-related protein [Hyphomicrobiales bacterium]|nr:Ketosteroid isomerase-related protein [Hyphomicrobiales bacterium]CAH1697304.1 Nuclear transport factor 2 family protein [Hyphomicrobiales bacterium]CAI0345490.1 taurine dehydrogenase small subunit [Hyphomicrobiales bacterium]